MAVVLALVAVYLANTFLVASDRKELTGTTKVAVAAVPLTYGVEITAEKIRFANYPTASLPPGSYSSVAALLPMGKKRVALLPIGVNEPVLASKISGEGQNASIAALLPDGMRAASVRINDVSGVAGFVQPNDSVDVLITRQVEGQGQQITDVLLQNVRIIAIGQDAKGADGKPNLARSATLEVEPLGAQKLALAQEVGSLSLVLRKPGDQQNNPVVETVSLDDLRFNLYGGVRYPQAASVNSPVAPRVQVNRVTTRRTTAPRPARPVTNSVEVFRGTTANNYEVKPYGS
ncbi:MAG: Flp pilus assembly protein CpaB [Sphingomicrobium sp.]